MFVNTTKFYHSTNKVRLAVLESHHKANISFCVQMFLTALYRKKPGTDFLELGGTLGGTRSLLLIRQTRLDCRVLDVTEALSSTVYIEFNKSVSAFSPKMQTSNNLR